MDKKINIRFSTHDGTAVPQEIEVNAINNINRWVAPIKDELIKAEAIVELYIDENGIQHVSFDNVSKELHGKALKTVEPYFPYR